MKLLISKHEVMIPSNTIPGKPTNETDVSVSVHNLFIDIVLLLNVLTKVRKSMNDIRYPSTTITTTPTTTTTTLTSISAVSVFFAYLPFRIVPRHQL